MKFVELSKRLREGLDPVYLVDGEDAYFREHAVSMIRSACAISMPALNDVRFEGETLKGEKLSSFLSDLNALPFLDGKRLVRACEFYPNEKEWALLEPYVKSPCPSTVLVIVNAGKKKGAADLRKKGGVTLVDCGKADEETLIKWILSVFRSKGMRVEGDAAVMLVRYCAQDAARMHSEAEKLRLLLKENGVVRASDVEEYVAKDTEYKIYELTQAASRKNFSAFSEIMHDLTEKGFDEYAVLAALVSHYRTLYEIVAVKGTDAQVASLLGIKPYAVQKNREAARRLGEERVRELYEKLYTLAAGSRSGGYTKTGAIGTAVAEIFFG